MDSSASYHRLTEPTDEISQIIKLTNIKSETEKDSDSQESDEKSKTESVAKLSSDVENSIITAEFTVGSEPRITLRKSRRKINNSTITKSRRNFLLIVVAIVAVIITLLIVYVTVLKNDTSDESLINFGKNFHIFTRNEWGGNPIIPGYSNVTYSHARKFIIISHTSSNQCMTLVSCSTYLRSFKNYDLNFFQNVDTGFNFLVGGDGKIYQALGWDIENSVKNNSILIAFIGNYVVNDVNDEQRVGVQNLLELGIKLGKIDKDYILVGHSQVSGTLSPGKYLMEDIKLWPHYYNDSLT